MYVRFQTRDMATWAVRANCCVMVVETAAEVHARPFQVEETLLTDI
jgi:hypothetical protein